MTQRAYCPDHEFRAFHQTGKNNSGQLFGHVKIRHKGKRYAIHGFVDPLTGFTPTGALRNFFSNPEETIREFRALQDIQKDALTKYERVKPFLLAMEQEAHKHAQPNVHANAKIIREAMDKAHKAAKAVQGAADKKIAAERIQDLETHSSKAHKAASFVKHTLEEEKNGKAVSQARATAQGVRKSKNTHSAKKEK